MTNFDRYTSLRQSSRVFQDGFKRRLEEVHACLFAGFPSGVFRLLDVGTADGLMLGRLQQLFPRSVFVGVESHSGLAKEAHRRGHTVVRAFAQNLPFEPESFDVITLVSTLKHVPDYEEALSECQRVLVQRGQLILSDPTPWGLRLGLCRGHFDRRYLPNIWSLNVAKERLRNAGFEIITGYRYMPLPFEHLGSRMLESLGATLGVSGFFMQQLVHVRRMSRRTDVRTHSRVTGIE